MEVVKRNALRQITLQILQSQQGLCPVCGRLIDASIKGEAVCDHDHNTGRIRGVLHRSCNAALGKMDNVVGRWGAKSMQYPHILAWLKRAVAYYEKPQYPLMYPGATTPEQRAEATRLKRNKAAAARRAKAKLEGLK